MTKFYTHDEALSESLKYFNGDELAAKVWIDKYALRDNEDNLLEKNPKQMHKRLAREFARIEKKKFKTPLSEEDIFECFDQFKYCIPQGSPMFGIGNDYQVVSLSNCYFLDTPLDSYADILRIDEQLIQISKRRGGVGICLDNLRPKGTPTKNAGKTSSGIIPFMERYSNSIREVGQQGRRGALILILSVKHPEIMNFIKVKNDKTKVTGANISVKITNEFMNAVKNNEDFELCWPIHSKNPVIQTTMKAREIWDELIKNSHEHAEPGILFWDTIENETPSDVYPEYKSKGVNPCVIGSTLVTTELGDIKIEDLVKLETKPKIVSFNEKDQKLEYDEIVCASKTRTDANVIKLELEDNTTITLTPDHKVYTENRGWIKASQLTEKDILLHLTENQDKTK